MSSPTLIDSHQHVFWHGKNDQDLIEDMDAHNIEVSWLLTWMGGGSASAFDPRFQDLTNDTPLVPLHSVIEVCRRYPDRFVAGYCPNPYDPNAVAKLAAAIDIHGVRVCGEWGFPILFDDPRCIEIYRYAGERGLPVVLHLDVPYLPPKSGTYVGNDRWYGGTIYNLERALKSCPQTLFVGHAPGFWRELSGAADDWPEAYLRPPLAPGGRLWHFFDTYPNLYADLSAGSALRALRSDPQVARDLLIQYSDRMLFGRDYHGGELLRFLTELDLPREVWRKIGRENAERILPSPTKPPLRRLG